MPRIVVASAVSPSAGAYQSCHVSQLPSQAPCPMAHSLFTAAAIGRLSVARNGAHGRARLNVIVPASSSATTAACTRSHASIRAPAGALANNASRSPA